MFRSILLASTLAVTLAGTAFAQGASYGGPRVIGGGRDAEVVYDAPSDNVVGGGYGRITGEAGNRSIAYGGAPQAQATTGLVAEITGEANNRHVTYRTPTEARGSGRLAGTPARTGG